MLTRVALYIIYVVVSIRSSATALLSLDSNTSETCWGDGKITLDVDNIPHILHCYDACLKAITKYGEVIKPTLFNKLFNNIACIIPTVNSEYYSGNIAYSTVDRANKLLEDAHNQEKSYTNGIFFKKDCKTARHIRSAEKTKIVPLTISGNETEKLKACEMLSKLHKGQDIDKVNIPIPQLDNNENPTKLKIPTESDSAYSINNPEAGVALTRYYQIVMKCLTLRNKHKHLIMRFNKDFNDWMLDAVTPHLGDTKVYPAFGSVLRVLETIKENDLSSLDYTTKAEGIFHHITSSLDDGTKIMNSKYFPIILVPWAITLCMLIVFIVWRSVEFSKCWRQYKDDNSSDSGTAILFYPVEESTTVSVAFGEEDGSILSSLSACKSDQKGYDTLGVTINQSDSMTVPKKKKQSRHGKKNDYQKNKSSSSGGEVAADSSVSQQRIHDTSSSSYENINNSKQKDNRNI